SAGSAHHEDDVAANEHGPKPKPLAWNAVASKHDVDLHEGAPKTSDQRNQKAQDQRQTDGDLNDKGREAKKVKIGKHKILQKFGVKSESWIIDFFPDVTVKPPVGFSLGANNPGRFL